jgi:uncharacterized membrane-anchored protein YjiN (DUF445 family)
MPFMTMILPASARRPLSLATMRRLASALLIVMSLIYFWAALNHAQGPVWGYVRAFAEAAMVGGLADWFAVTAIFRRPLGLPIPHTAVIPRSKERIAMALGDFVAINFLAPDVVAQSLAKQDIAGALARQIADPVAARRIANGVLDALPALLALIEDEAVSDFIRRQAAQLAGSAHLSAAMGRGLKLLTEHGRHQPLIDAALVEGFRALEQNEAAIRAQVRGRTGWLWRLVGLDARASEALIGAIEDTLRGMARDHDHPARRHVTELLSRLSYDLEHAPKLRAEIQRIALDFVAHPALGAYAGDVWRGLKATLRDSADAEATRAALAEAIQRFGAALGDDQETQDALNRRLRALLAELAGRHGRDASTLIADTIRGWDSKTVVAKLEQNVGPDLQYIRINGTLIGGVVGLAIHQITVLVA